MSVLFHVFLGSVIGKFVIKTTIRIANKKPIILFLWIFTLSLLITISFPENSYSVVAGIGYAVIEYLTRKFWNDRIKAYSIAIALDFILIAIISILYSNTSIEAGMGYALLLLGASILGFRKEINNFLLKAEYYFLR